MGAVMGPPSGPGAGAGTGTASGMESGSPAVHRRLRIFRTVLALTVLLLASRLWWIQFARGAELRRQAEANSFVPREIEADRGVMYDSAGRKLVVNSPRFTVSVVPAALPEDSAARWRALGRLAEMLDVPLRNEVTARAFVAEAESESEAARAALEADRLSVEELLSLSADGGVDRGGWGPIPIARNVLRARAFAVMEAAVEWPFVLVGESSVREYPSGPTMGQILGFAGPIPEHALDTYLARDYRIYDVVGRDGLEATYEDYLRGVKGEKIVEIDASGREQRQIGAARPSAPGYSLHLTVDLEFQRAAEEALAKGLRDTGARSGAIVALDPRSGAVRALVSLPNYDNNMFSIGARPSEFADLLDNPDRPLVNRSIAGLYAPGSTFKMITAAAGLQEGVITTRTRIFDPGHIALTNEFDPEQSTPFYCWLRTGHGWLDVKGAIANSCNVFFYETAGGFYDAGYRQEGLGSDRLGSYARSFGLGSSTGIELLGEADGRVPSKQWLAEWSDEIWTTGLTYDMGIGQANILVTPIQMAQVTAAVANGGTIHKPYLVERIAASDGTNVARPPREPFTVSVDPQHLAVIREGMLGAVEYGTAQRAWTHLPSEVSVAGKTGTAIFCDYIGDVEGGPCRRDKHANLLTHGWFVAVAPATDPEIVLAVLVDGSGLDYLLEGSQHAAPIAANVLRAYFDLPTPAPTPAPTATPCVDCVEATSTPPADGVEE